MKFGTIAALDDVEPKLDPSVFVAPGAFVLGRVEAAADASFWYTSVARGDVVRIEVGARSNVQDGAILHGNEGGPECIIGEDVTIGHRAIVHGATLEDRVLVGMGAIVLDGAVIGEDSLIGAGALVTGGTHIPSGSMVLGSPARVVRRLRPEEIQALWMSAAHYVQTAAKHAESLRGQTSS